MTFEVLDEFAELPGGSAEGGEHPCWVMLLTRRQAEYITDLLACTSVGDLSNLGLVKTYENMESVFGLALDGVGIELGDVLVWNKGAQRFYSKGGDGE